jgi:serine/threonine protein kinase
MPLTIGTRLGVYEILSPLGVGGMGEVYRARDTKLGRDVAIKVLPSSFAADPERLARFEREARLLASLNHPNIGAIYGVEESAGVTALVLELVEGDTLAERIRGTSGVGADPRVGPIGGHAGPPLRVAEALSIARQIADALDAAHERGIVHRDLKPANIKITPDGVVKVLDFGLAKGSGGAGRSGGSDGVDEDVAQGLSPADLTHSPTMLAPTLDGVLLGTAPYMSPEQARGKAVDKRTDRAEHLHDCKQPRRDLEPRERDRHRARQPDRAAPCLGGRRNARADHDSECGTQGKLPYRKQVVFVDASFQLNPGEKVGLVGPNGSGTSTLFRMSRGGSCRIRQGYRVPLDPA